jgi:Fe-S-cluster containining protein
MKTDLTQYERSYCRCELCRAPCKSCPGHLVPTDVHTLSDYIGIEQDDPAWYDWFLKHFEASEGALVVRDGRAFRVPTIVPAQHEDGRCVFLDAEERCTIHPAAPFGCRMFRVCTTEDGEDERSAAGLEAICASMDYQLTWAWLRTKGRIAKPLAERKVHLRKLLEGTKTEE